MPRILSVMGPTGSGKTALLEAAKAEFPDIGLVQVGKMFLAKYPPGHFDGKAALEKTETEAMALLDEGLRANRDREVVLVDGQPRTTLQLAHVCAKYHHTDLWFLFLTASEDVRLDRAVRPGESQDKTALRVARVKNDVQQLYPVLCTLVQGKSVHHLRVVNTDHTKAAAIVDKYVMPLVYGYNWND